MLSWAVASTQQPPADESSAPSAWPLRRTLGAGKRLPPWPSAGVAGPGAVGVAGLGKFSPRVDQACPNRSCLGGNAPLGSEGLRNHGGSPGIGRALELLARLGFTLAALRAHEAAPDCDPALAPRRFGAASRFGSVFP